MPSSAPGNNSEALDVVAPRGFHQCVVKAKLRRRGRLFPKDRSKGFPNVVKSEVPTSGDAGRDFVAGEAPDRTASGNASKGRQARGRS